MQSTHTISEARRKELLQILETRFTAHRERHADVRWDRILERLESNPDALWSVNAMERTGGEPDIISLDATSNDYQFVDCSLESPAGRRNTCYDREAQEARKQHAPKANAIDLCRDMGITLLTQDQYKQLQKFGPFDTKTSSWILTPPSIRKLGGALFADFRYNSVFVYHNGADSYYSARGFRGALRV